MAFTGLYFEYYYYTVWIFTFKYRKGAYDYYNGREEICGVRTATNLVKVSMTSTKAREYTKQLNKQLNKEL